MEKLMNYAHARSKTAVADADAYSDHVNPQWARLLDLLGMNASYERCLGAELFTADGKRYLDFLSGYCVHNTGHNHPEIVTAIKDELDRSGPAMLQSHVPHLAGELAARLCSRAGGRLNKVFFTSSGSEGIESTIKFAHAHTRRPGILYAEGAFHGLTCGALSLMGDPFWRDGFGPLLPDTEQVSFGAVEELERKLSTRRFAALILEPIQAEAGVRVPDPEYLRTAQSLCRRYGTLFALDEVQTGMYRTGSFLASRHFELDPDIVVLAKALSGGLVPCGAVLMSDAVCQSVYGSIQRAMIHASTFGENSLAMRAGLATLEVLEKNDLGNRARVVGERLRDRLKQVLSGFDMFDEVRGLGLLCGIAFKSPRPMRLRIPFEAFSAVHPALFGQMLVMRLFKDKNVLAQICGNNFMVLKVAPPLMIEDRQVDDFISAIEGVVEMVHSSSAFWSDAVVLGRRALRV